MLIIKLTLPAPRGGAWTTILAQKFPIRIVRSWAPVAFALHFPGLDLK
jgi:hypothetical protein